VASVSQYGAHPAGLDGHRDTIADTRFRIRRRIRADQQADLGAPLSYE
jgi:hypothetical protein